MKISSAKAKGRLLCSLVKTKLLQTFPWLMPGDILVTSSGAPGKDLSLSPRALEYFPYVIECKNQNRVNIYRAIAQAKSHQCKEEACDWLVIFKKNHGELFVCLDFDRFLTLFGKNHENPIPTPLPSPDPSLV